VSDKDPLMLHALENRFLRTPNVRVVAVDAGEPSTFDAVPAELDSVVCLNVLEFEQDPGATLKAIARVLPPSAKVVVLVPYKRALFGSIDGPLGHLRRFERKELLSLMASAGLRPVEVRDFNRVGSLSWLVYGKFLRRKRISKITLKLFDKTVWLWRRIDRLMPWPGLSLIVVAERPAETNSRTEATPAATDATPAPDREIVAARPR
jgi:SAM-dependent methyltransferase